MKVAYIGRVTLSRFEQFGMVPDHALPSVSWGFPLGSDIVVGLLKRGHEVHVIVEHGWDYASEAWQFDSIKDCGGLIVHLVPGRKRSRWSYLTLFSKEVREIRKIITQIRPDVCFAQWSYYYAYAALTSGYPTLVVIHDSPWRIAFVNKNLMSIVKALYAQLFVFPRMMHATTVSPYIVKELKRWNRYAREVKVIPNGIMTCDLPCAPIRKQATTVVCVADWSARKNVKTFFRALRCSARKNFSRYRAIVFGGGLSWEGSAGEWLRKQGWNINGLELRGQASRKEIDKVLLEEADLFVSPTLEESFGMIFIEAMRFGIPCIGGEKSGAVPWVIGNGGVTCDVTSPEKLAACIECVMGNEELRRKLSDAGRRRVRGMFDIDHVVDLYEQELKRVAQC